MSNKTISPETIRKIKDASIIDVTVGAFIEIKKVGVGYKAICPFHQGNSESFTLTPRLNIYKCFGCGKSGNSISFLMDHKGMTYPEALRWLAQKFNIIID